MRYKDKIRGHRGVGSRRNNHTSEHVGGNARAVRNECESKWSCKIAQTSGCARVALLGLFSTTDSTLFSDLFSTSDSTLFLSTKS